VPHVVSGVTAHKARGSTVLFVACAHVPLTPPVSAAAQAMQAASHALLQHTPSTQKPLSQGVAAAQGCPLAS